MGGMLLYSQLAQHPEQIAAGVTICSPAALHHPLRMHRMGRRFAWAIARHGVVPTRALAGIAAPLGKANPLFGTLANRHNLDWPTANGLARAALVDLPTPLLHQAATWYDRGAIVSAEGDPWVKSVDVPIRVFGASHDRVVAAADAAAACAQFPRCTYTLLGTESGFAVDYGHVDTVLGQSAEREVYPLIEAFLAEQRAALSTTIP